MVTEAEFRETMRRNASMLAFGRPDADMDQIEAELDAQEARPFQSGLYVGGHNGGTVTITKQGVIQ
jgi:hypothetical protein